MHCMYSFGTFEFTRIISMIYSPKSENYLRNKVAPNTLVFYREFFDEENGNNFEDCSYEKQNN